MPLSHSLDTIGPLTRTIKDNAIIKLKKKNLDFIVLNSLNDFGAGFDVDTNKIKIIDSNNTIQEFELKAKNKVAKDIVDQISLRMYETII